ncbi:Transcription factor gsfR2 [Paramyrothecium foliicola]|nr:Transcription factor gsfR2 [Paramyrothecium foliicola]
MSLSRRRSCTACARGKRRCDLGFPECGRCLRRRATCEYAWISPGEAQELVHTPRLDPWTPQQITQHYLPSQTGLPEGPLWNSHLSGPQRSHVGHDLASGPLYPLTLPSILPPALAPLVDEIIGRGKTVSFVTPDIQTQHPSTSGPNVALVSSALQAPQSNSAASGSFEVASDSSIIAGSIFRARTEYAASRLALQIQALAETGQTTFIHRTQTEASPILRDTLAICSLTVMRNSTNAFLIRSEIARRVELLIEATETAISLASPSAHSPEKLNLLHTVQAMLIYQCMRLFSAGDSAQKAQAERDAVPLAKWIGILEGQTQYWQENSVTGTNLNVSVWQDWIQAESIRRTMVFAELVDGIYDMLKSGWYKPNTKMPKLSFTGQAAIWQARSMAEWQQATQLRPCIEIHMSDFHHDVESALPDDLDELGIVLRASYEGMDALKRWLGSDTRLLERWGLKPSDDFASSCY